MDNWFEILNNDIKNSLYRTNLQMQMMIIGGNNALAKYFVENKIEADSFMSIDQKFKTKECENYRQKVILVYIYLFYNEKIS